MEVDVSKLKRHAEKFGEEGILEAARDEGLTIKEMVDLQMFLDDLNAKREGRWWKRPRKTAEQRVRKFLGLPENPEEEES